MSIYQRRRVAAHSQCVKGSNLGHSGRQLASLARGARSGGGLRRLERGLRNFQNKAELPRGYIFIPQPEHKSSTFWLLSNESEKQLTDTRQFLFGVFHLASKTARSGLDSAAMLSVVPIL